MSFGHYPRPMTAKQNELENSRLSGFEANPEKYRSVHWSVPWSFHWTIMLLNVVKKCIYIKIDCLPYDCFYLII